MKQIVVFKRCFCFFVIILLEVVPLYGCQFITTSKESGTQVTEKLPSSNSPIVSLSAPSKRSILPSEAVTFDVSIIGGTPAKMSGDKVELVTNGALKCERIEFSDISEDSAVLTVGSCTGAGSFRVRVLDDVLLNDKGEGNEASRLSRKVVVLKEDGEPPPDDVGDDGEDPPAPPPPPGPVTDPECNKGNLPVLAYQGFPGWYGLRDVRIGAGETHVWCFNLQTDQDTLVFSIVDRTHTAQCMYHTADYIPPVGSSLTPKRWTNEIAGSAASFRTWGKGYLPKGIYKVRITASENYPTCPFNYEITAHP